MFARFWPEPVPLPLGGLVLPVREYRLGDLAKLERWARGQLGNVFAALGAAGSISDRAERREWLVAAYDAAERYGDGLADPDVSKVLGTLPGLVEQLRLATGSDADTLRAGLLDATPGQLDAALAVAWAVQPLDFAQIACDREAGVELPHRRSTAAGGDWRKGMWAIIEATHYTPEQIGNLYLSQWEVIRGGGEVEPSAIVTPERPKGWTEDEFKDRVLRRRKRWFEGLSSDSGDQSPGASPEPAPGPP